jgi:hypothetical protein
MDEDFMKNDLYILKFLKGYFFSWLKAKTHFNLVVSWLNVLTDWKTLYIVLE